MENWTNLELLLPALLGALINFFSEYKAKQKTGFSAGFWIKDNWLNLIGLYLATVMIGYSNLTMLKNAVVMIIVGFALNKIYDYIQDFLSKEHA